MKKRFLLIIEPYDNIDGLFIHEYYETYEEAQQGWHDFMGRADISETYKHLIWVDFEDDEFEGYDDEF